MPALLVLDAAAAAVPVLPDDPLEVLDLEREERHDPEECLALTHPLRMRLAPEDCMGRPAGLRGRTVLVEVLIGGEGEELDELVTQGHLLEERARLVVALPEVRDLLLDRPLDGRALDPVVPEPLPDL